MQSDANPKECPHCFGTGKWHRDETCEKCGGWGGFHGNIAYSGDYTAHEVVTVPDCSVCNNTGKVKKMTTDNCIFCRGTGRIGSD